MISATISAAEAAATTWDVVVIGAGPSGGLAARQLASAGARTLLVDRCPFPRAKVCGACVNRSAVAALESAGLERLVGKLGGVPLTGWQLQSRGRAVRLGLDGGLAVSRSRFDAMLVTAACRAGAFFLPETTATVLPIDGLRSQFRDVRLAEGRQTSRIVRSGVVIAADGLGHPSLRQLDGFRPRVHVRSRMGLGAALDEFPASYARGSIYMAVGNGGYVGLVRLEDGTLNVAAAVDQRFLRGAGGPARAVTTILQEAGFPSIPSLATTTWRGTPPLTQRTDPPAATRVFVIGDAAGYVEPFTGEGIAWALQSAAAVVPLVLRGVDRWEPQLAAEWRTMHRRRIVRRQWICRAAASGLRHRPLVGALIQVFLTMPTLGSRIVQSIVGSPARCTRAPQ